MAMLIFSYKVVKTYLSRWQKSILVCSLLVLVSCKPDKIELTLYASDLKEAINNKILEVPIKITFSSFTDDKDNLFERASEAAKGYLAPGSKFSISQGNYTKSLVIESMIPLGTDENLRKIYTSEKRLAFLIVNNTQVTFRESKNLKELNAILSDINLMIGVNLPAKRTSIRLVNDEAEPFKFKTFSTWISKAPYLEYNAELNKRQEVEILFKGGDDSIWSQLNPTIFY